MQLESGPGRRWGARGAASEPRSRRFVLLFRFWGGVGWGTDCTLSFPRPSSPSLPLFLFPSFPLPPCFSPSLPFLSFYFSLLLSTSPHPNSNLNTSLSPPQLHPTCTFFVFLLSLSSRPSQLSPSLLTAPLVRLLSFSGKRGGGRSSLADWGCTVISFLLKSPFHTQGCSGSAPGLQVGCAPDHSVPTPHLHPWFAPALCTVS